MLERHLRVPDKEPRTDQRVDGGAPRVDITDDRALVEVSQALQRRAAPDVDAPMLGFGMYVEQQPAGAERAMDRAQSVDDALWRDSSQRPGEDHHVEGLRG
jgi:hypothetical protein